MRSTLKENTISELSIGQCKLVNVFGNLVYMPSKIDNILTLLNKDSVNVYAMYSNDEILVENIKRQCPYCNRRKIHIHEWKGRTLHFYDIKNIRIKVPGYECTRCGRTFMADLTSIVDKSANFTNNLRMPTK